MKKLNIVVDENIAIPEAFSVFGNVLKVNGREISNELLKNCDVLIIRSITKVDENLLDNTSVKMVASATSGIDNIDLKYLNDKKIFFADAKGCNSYSVAEYVITAISVLLKEYSNNFEFINIGIIGFGNIGSKLVQMTQALGMKVFLNDPPLERQSNNSIFSPMDKILNADIITLHIPLTFEGQDKTYNLLNENLELLKENSIIINTSRGGVVNENRLIQSIIKKKSRVITDVWCNEPEINVELLKYSEIATPHIAGYSTEGKLNGTKIIFEKLNEFLETEYKFNFELSVPLKVIEFNEDLSPKSLFSLLKSIYNIEEDSNLTKRMIDMPEEIRAIYFDTFRKNYSQRKSFKDFMIRTKNRSLKEKLENLRFKVEVI
jgi:erythronate-4-phosphate dehydrogenase